MTYETSYASGRKPYTPDLQRGFWSSPTDFIYVCLGFAFKMDFFAISGYFFIQMGIYAVVPYIIIAALIVIPLMVIFMYLGQFSSSGFITAFRISPFFKGMGLVSLFLNTTVLMYYGIFAVIPLTYLFNSFKPTLPWSCENARKWINQTGVSVWEFCNETEPVIDLENENETAHMYHYTHVPSIAFFTTHFSNLNLSSYSDGDLSFSWTILGYNLLLWTIIALIFYQFYQTETLGRLLRYLFWLVIGLLVVCIVRFSFLPGAHKALHNFIMPDTRHLMYVVPFIPIAAVNAFGAGFGILIALSSHNRFKTNIMRYSWIICVGQMFIGLGFGLISQLIEQHFGHVIGSTFYAYVESHWILYLAAGSALESMHWANLWSILYFLMLFLACVFVMLTQFMAIFSSVFDEFDKLRQYKLEFRMIFIAVLALSSIYFCSNHGMLYFTALSLDSIFTQLALTMLLLLVILWVYGRIRTQRDIEFMLSQPFATWKVFLLRYLSPIAMTFLLILTIYLAFYEHMISSNIILYAGILLIFLPWLFIPGYGILAMLQTTGPLYMRFKRCCRPTDWYPMEPEDRQRYEEALGNMDITHQLNEVLEEVH